MAITLAEWTRDIALILSAVAGLLHWGWWFPVLFGAVAAVVREASQGFVLIHRTSTLTREGKRSLTRHLLKAYSQFSSPADLLRHFRSLNSKRQTRASR